MGRGGREKDKSEDFPSSGKLRNLFQQLINAKKFTPSLKKFMKRRIMMVNNKVKSAGLWHQCITELILNSKLRLAE